MECRTLAGISREMTSIGSRVRSKNTYGVAGSDAKKLKSR